MLVACCDAAVASPSARPALNCAGRRLPRSRSERGSLLQKPRACGARPTCAAARSQRSQRARRTAPHRQGLIRLAPSRSALSVRRRRASRLGERVGIRAEPDTGELLGSIGIVGRTVGGRPPISDALDQHRVVPHRGQCTRRPVSPRRARHSRLPSHIHHDAPTPFRARKTGNCRSLRTQIRAPRCGRSVVACCARRKNTQNARLPRQRRELRRSRLVQARKHAQERPVARWVSMLVRALRAREAAGCLDLDLDDVLDLGAHPLPTGRRMGSRMFSRPTPLVCTSVPLEALVGSRRCCHSRPRSSPTARLAKRATRRRLAASAVV